MFEVQAGAALTELTLDDPARRNALGSDDLEEFREIVEAIDTPVTYVSGSGSAFCAGADLDEVGDLNELRARVFARAGQRAFRAIERSNSVFVAGIDGPARGGGVELALACDLRVATPEASFAEPGVQLGIFGAWGGTIRLPRVVGAGNALDLSLSGRAVDAQEALRMGLISQIVEDPETVAVDLTEFPADALMEIKHRVRDDDPYDTQASEEAAAFGRLLDVHARDIRSNRAGKES